MYFVENKKKLCQSINGICLNFLDKICNEYSDLGNPCRDNLQVFGILSLGYSDINIIYMVNYFVVHLWIKWQWDSCVYHLF